MSVMVISPQMIADATKKAQTFRSYGFSHEEKMMCPTLAEMNDNDIKHDEYEVKEFFCRLYKWNVLSAELKHLGGFTKAATLQNEFNEAIKLANDIDIYQFQMILRFLHYNIENHEFANDLRKQMDADVELLQKIKDEVCGCIVDALQEEKGCKWYY